MAPKFANTPGCHIPGWTAAMTLSRSVAIMIASDSEVDSCWYSAE